MSDMKLIMENWNKFVNEEKKSAIDVFYEVCEEKESQRQGLLKEFQAAEIEIGGAEGLSARVSAMGKWSGLTAMTGIAAYTGLQAYALSVGGLVGTAFVLSGVAVPLAVTGALTYAYFRAKKMLPNWLQNIFSKLDTKHDPLEAAQEKIKKMLAAAQERADLTEDQAAALLQIVNTEVNKDEKCIQLSEDLLLAIEDNNSSAASTLTDKLDDTVSGVILRLQEELKAHMLKNPDADVADFEPQAAIDRREKAELEPDVDKE